MYRAGHTIPSIIAAATAVAVVAFVAVLAAAALLQTGDRAVATGADSPSECTNADFTDRNSPFTAPPGEIVTGVCIKSGDDAFAGGKKHSGLITQDGTYGLGGCYLVSGIGTATVSVTINPQATGCKAVSHIDVNTGPPPTPTPTPTPTSTPTSTGTPPATATVAATATATATPTVEAEVLAEVAGPRALPATGQAPDGGAGLGLALLLALGGLLLAGGVGTLALELIRRRR